MNLATMVRVPLVDGSGTLKNYYLPIYQGWILVKPLVELVGMSWTKQFLKLKTLSYVEQKQLTLPASNGDLVQQSRYYVCIPTSRTLDYLLTLNPRKSETKSRLSTLIKLLPELLKEPEGQEPVPDTLPELETEVIQDARTVDEIYKELFPITVDKPLDRLDYIRKDLVAVGLRNAEEINYICKGAAVLILSHKADGNHLSSHVFVHTYEQGDLLKAAKAGYYPIPEFFRRYPSEYQQLKMWTVQVERQNDSIKSPIVSATKVRVPLAMAPWFTDKFAEEISRLKYIAQVVEDRKRKAELKERVLRGDSLDDLLEFDDYEYYDFIHNDVNAS
ncbi:hypothetical protein CRG49_002075 [Neisseria sp. N95_16]|uniref:Uncharacterized protein n=1 Tax=Neisseria brasiliensis TaxID=2666100 RepID=A0A7X2GZ46_9NEIS|nr:MULTISPECIES: hypothetical protein [Neisseria]MRN38575.1 hypothetical protein [Neisseria brasiliensis]PJO10492.1 hypothetical protein CRG49_002075 [Neisseria sp. N95_16]